MASECAVQVPIVTGNVSELAARLETDGNQTYTQLSGNNNATCIDAEQFAILKQIALREKIAPGNMIKRIDYAGIVNMFLDYLKITNERDIWRHHVVQKYIGPQMGERIKLTAYKVPGPSDSNRLLNNFNIDAVLQSYALRSQSMFGKRFCALTFEMIDFANNPHSALWNFDYNTSKWDCMGIVLNSDVSTGPGKHWFSLYVELGKPEINIEYFNSSSRLPYEEIIAYYEKVKRDHPNRQVTLQTVVKHRIQESRTECGMFSIIYIIGRLEGNPPDLYIRKQLSDNDMYKYRKIIFAQQ